MTAPGILSRRLNVDYGHGVDGPLNTVSNDPQRNLKNFRGQFLTPEARYRRERSRRLAEMSDEALAAPEAQGERFLSFFDTAARGIAEPAQRDFARTLGGVGANVASRFGGNPSTMEGAATDRAGEMFSRSLTEALARLAPQAAGMGLDYTGLLGDRSSAATGEQDRASEMVQQSIAMQKKKKGLLGTIGSAIGAGVGLATKAL